MDIMYVASIVLILLMNLYCTQANPAGTQASISDVIENDLRSRETAQRLANIDNALTQRILNFESQFVQRLATLEAKFTVHAEETTNDNALAVAAEIMKAVMHVQKQNVKLEKTMMDLKAKIELEHTENEQKMQDIKQSIIDLDSRHSQNFKNISKNMLQNNQEITAEVQTLIEQKQEIVAEVEQLAENHVGLNGTLQHTVQQLQQEKLSLQTTISELSHNSSLMEQQIDHLSVSGIQKDHLIRSLNLSLSRLTAENVEATQNSNALKTNVKTVTDTVLQLQQTTISIQQTMADKSTITDKKIGTLLNTAQQQEQEIGNLRKNITTLGADLKTATDPSMVVFSGRRSSYGTVSDGSPIIFNNDMYSVGGGYNTTNGIFYCPIKGWYMFDVTITANSAYAAAAYLRKNNNEMMYVWSGQSSSNGYHSGSRSISLQLNVGDEVYVRSNGNSYYIQSYLSITLISKL